VLHWAWTGDFRYAVDGNMDQGIHFISGLPRSGSTLLAALLRQNPRFHAGIISPAGGLFTVVTRAMGQDNETAVFVDDAKRRAVLRGLFDNYYEQEHPRQVVFDTNRLWAAKLGALKELFPEARTICCVRHPPWIFDSVERLVQRNPLQASKIFNFEAATTVYARYEMIGAGTGLVGYAFNALREAFYGPHSDRLMLLTYETLASDPARAMRAVYEFIGEPEFPHRFDQVEFSNDEFDVRLGAPGLHTVRPTVGYTPRETILPPDLFRRVEKDAFWGAPDAKRRGVPII